MSAGTNAAKPRPRFANIAPQANGRVRLQFTAKRGPVYIVEASTNLADWEAIGVAKEAGDGWFEFEGLQTGRTPAQFYRIVSP